MSPKKIFSLWNTYNEVTAWCRSVILRLCISSLTVISKLKLERSHKYAVSSWGPKARRPDYVALFRILENWTWEEVMLEMPTIISIEWQVCIQTNKNNSPFIIHNDESEIRKDCEVNSALLFHAYFNVIFVFHRGENWWNNKTIVLIVTQHVLGDPWEMSSHDGIT